MRDKLKEMVKSKRASFETHDFDIDLGWNELSEKLIKTSSYQPWKWMIGVAASLVIFGSFVFVTLGTSSHQDTELTEAEYYYEQMIDAKLVQVKKQVTDPILLADIEQLDQAFLELKKDLKDNLDNEEVIMAMMENYQLKLRILERILQEIEEDEKEEEATVGL
jgi:arsenate reductase-like glutaredoxin family protein